MKKLEFQLTTLKRQTLFLQLALPVVFALGLGLGWAIWGRAAAAKPAVNIPEEVRRYDVPVDNAPALGPADAPITIVEFSDYQCPYCQKWYDEVLTRLLKDYENKIRFVYRDFPLPPSIHPEAQPAAEAAHCAGEQGAYWQFHNAIFSNKYMLSAQAYQKYAEELGLDLDAFNTCISDHRYKSVVEDNVNVAFSVEVGSTPTFFINGMKVVGAQPYAVFQQIIDKELAGEIQK
ncbi:MAG: DsbA family protein [Chloroflexi bacterium]|nr:MAG: DsbA family protein [Chloroflexota bacterium]